MLNGLIAGVLLTATCTTQSVGNLVRSEGLPIGNEQLVVTRVVTESAGFIVNSRVVPSFRPGDEFEVQVCEGVNKALRPVGTQFWFPIVLETE